MNSRYLFRRSALARYSTRFFVVFIGIAAFGQAGRGGISGTVSDPMGQSFKEFNVAMGNGTGWHFAVVPGRARGWPWGDRLDEMYRARSGSAN
jgi:hypothetical protein